MGKPAARITDMHTCPMVTPGMPPIPHVGGPVVMGSPNVITGGLPQARVGDMLVCVGPPDVIAKGSSGVFVNGRPAARLGDQTAHGGVIVVGLPTVLIGEMGGGSAGGAASPADGAALAFAAAEAQIKTLVDAAKTGTPFCEVCFQKATAAAKAAAAKMAAAAKKPAPVPAKKPPPESALPPKKAAAGNVVCELVALKLQCSHGRQPGAEKILMVVGNAKGGSTGASASHSGVTVSSTIPDRSSDSISGTITMKGGCGEHAAWAVSGETSAQGHGTSFKFDAATAGLPVLNILALRNIAPGTSRIDADACHGGPVSYEVRAYPPGKLSLEIEPNKIVDDVIAFLKHLPIEPETVESWKKNWFVGKVDVCGTWSEDKSWQAVYLATLSGGYDPIFSISHRGLIWGIPIPPRLAEYLKAGIYYNLSGSTIFTGDATSTYWPYTGKTAWTNASIKGGGRLKGSLSAEMTLVRSDVASATFLCNCGLSVSASGEFGNEATAKLTFGIDAIVGSVKIEIFGGLLEITREVDLMQEKQFTKEWPLFGD